MIDLCIGKDVEGLILHTPPAFVCSDRGKLRTFL